MPSSLLESQTKRFMIRFLLSIHENRTIFVLIDESGTPFDLINGTHTQTHARSHTRLSFTLMVVESGTNRLCNVISIIVDDASRERGIQSSIQLSLMLRLSNQTARTCATISQTIAKLFSTQNETKTSNKPHEMFLFTNST